MTTRPPKYLAPCDVKRPKITPFDNHVARCSNRAGHRGPHFDRAENVRWWTRA